MDKAPGSVWPRLGASLPRAVQLAGQVQLCPLKAMAWWCLGQVLFPMVGCLEETCSLGEQTRMSEDQHRKVSQTPCIRSQSLFLLGD